MLRNQGTFMLKKILHLLLSKFYSKRESDTVARCAMPSGIATIIPSDSGKIVSEDEYQVLFVAPVTGYVYQIVGNTIGLENCFSLITNHTAGISAQCNGFRKFANRVTLPCSKGDTIMCGRSAQVPVSEVIIRVSTAVGQVISSGGGNIYRKIFHSRRCLCLKRFLLSCWKNLSTQNVSGLQKHPFLQQLRAQSTLLQRSQANGLVSRLRFPGIFVFVLSPQVCFLVMGFYGKVRMMTPPTIRALRYLATRAAKLRICYRSILGMRMCSSQRTWRIQCDLKGGASC